MEIEGISAPVSLSLTEAGGPVHLPQRCTAALALPERARHPVAGDVAARRQPLLPAAPPVAAAHLARRPRRLHLPRLAHLQARRATGPVRHAYRLHDVVHRGDGPSRTSPHLSIAGKRQVLTASHTSKPNSGERLRKAQQVPFIPGKYFVAREGEKKHVQRNLISCGLRGRRKRRILEDLAAAGLMIVLARRTHTVTCGPCITATSPILVAFGIIKLVHF